MGHPLVVSSRRLFAAADALLNAMESDAGIDRLVLAPSHDGYDRDSAPTKAFTQTELRAALEVLTRMGFATQDAARRREVPL
jgi:hypothetical protein